MTTGRLPADSKASQLVAGKASDDRSRSLFAEARVYSERLGQELRSLQHSREQVLTIINLIPVALFVKDKNSRLFLVNQVCELQWGVCFSDLRDTERSLLSSYPALTCFPRDHPQSEYVRSSQRHHL